MKDELGAKIMTEFTAHRPKTYSYLIDDDNDNKKAEETKKSVIKWILKFNDCKDCLFKNEIILKSQQIFESEATVYIQKMIKDCKLLTELHHIHKSQILERYLKQSC